MKCKYHIFGHIHEGNWEIFINMKSKFRLKTGETLQVIGSVDFVTKLSSHCIIIILSPEAYMSVCVF